MSFFSMVFCAASFLLSYSRVPAASSIIDRIYDAKHYITQQQHPFNGPFPGLPKSASTRKAKPIWIFLKQETVSGSVTSWAICKSAPGSRQTTTPAPHQSVFTGWIPFLPPSQQRQSTEANHSITGHVTQMKTIS